MPLPEGIADLSHTRMRIRDEGYEDGWEKGVRNGRQQFARELHAHDVSMHYTRSLTHRRWYWFYFGITIALLVLLEFNVVPRLYELMLVAIGSTLTLTLVHYRKWDSHYERCGK